MRVNLTLINTIRSDFKRATDDRDKFKAQALRMLLSEIEYADMALSSDEGEEQLRELLNNYYRKLDLSRQDYPEGQKRDEIGDEMSLVASYIPQVNRLISKVSRS